MDNAKILAKTLREKLNTLHDTVVSENPFEWTDNQKERDRRSQVYNEVSDALSAFRYIPKTGKIAKILIFGTALPLIVIAALWGLGMPADEDTRILVWGGLGVIAIVFAIVAAIIADNPDIDEDLALAACVAPRNWSFSRVNTRDAWQAYRKRFGYFNQGDEDQGIRRRLWGWFDGERKRPFQMFHFYFEEVYYTTQSIKNAKGHTIGYRRVKHEVPHSRYGMFAAMPESKIRLRLTETGGNPGFDTEVKLEYAALNKAANVYCDKTDELATRQFLSPAVQEIVMAFSDWLPDLVLDFYPGFVMLVTTHNPFGELRGIELDEHTGQFRETIRPGVDHLVGITTGISEKLRDIAKYND